MAALGASGAAMAQGTPRAHLTSGLRSVTHLSGSMPISLLKAPPGKWWAGVPGLGVITPLEVRFLQPIQPMAESMMEAMVKNPVTGSLHMTMMHTMSQMPIIGPIHDYLMGWPGTVAGFMGR